MSPRDKKAGQDLQGIHHRPGSAGERQQGMGTGSGPDQNRDSSWIKLGPTDVSGSTILNKKIVYCLNTHVQLFCTFICTYEIQINIITLSLIFKNPPLCFPPQKKRVQLLHDIAQGQ